MSSRKPEHPGFVDPTTLRSRSRARSQSRPRRSQSRGARRESSPPVKSEPDTPTKKGSTNGHASYAAVTASTAKPAEKKEPVDYKVDNSGVYEFCGPWGVSLVMLGFPIMMYYFWIGHVYYDAQFPWPEKGEPLEEFGKKLVKMALEVCIMR